MSEEEYKLEFLKTLTIDNYDFLCSNLSMEECFDHIRDSLSIQKRNSLYTFSLEEGKGVEGGTYCIKSSKELNYIIIDYVILKNNNQFDLYLINEATFERYEKDLISLK